MMLCTASSKMSPFGESEEPSVPEGQVRSRWAKRHGYAIAVSRSPKQYVYLQCDKGGTLKNCHNLTPETRRRNTSSARCGCPFKVRLKCIEGERWTLTVVNGDHNHPPSSSSLTHAIQRRIDVVTKETILELHAHNNQPREIVALLAQRKNPVSVTSKDISNLIQRNHAEHRHGREPIEVLLEWLEEREWPHSVMTAAIETSSMGDGNSSVDSRNPSSSRRLEGLFFAHPRGLMLLRRFGTVTIIDATYNTNKHRLPLLHFVGLTSTNRSFTIAIAFLPNESTMSYMWALQALQQHEPESKPLVVVTDDDAALGGAVANVFTHEFSNIHCQWHVRENVKKVARRRLLDDADYETFLSDFDELRDAPTLERLKEARDALEARWSHFRPDLVDYVDSKLSSEHLWSAVYINRHPHLGSRTTSRAEGAHATMKAFLHSRHGNLFNVAKALLNHFTTQHVLIKDELAADLHKVPVSILNKSFYIELSRNVSRFALRMLAKEDEMAQRIIFLAKQQNSTSVPTCDEYCIIQPTMGLPCCHQMAQWKANGQPIPLSSIYDHWRTSQGLHATQQARLLDPLDSKQRKIAAATKATGRLLTGAELAEATRRKAVRHCSNCRQKRQNCSTCPDPCARCKSPDKVNECTSM